MRVLSRKFYPVVHCLSPEDQEEAFWHAFWNTHTAVKNGADGVFLTGQGVSASDLIGIYQHVRERFPDIWLGINFVGISPQKSFAALSSTALYCDGLNALWTDGMPDYYLPLPSSIQLFGGVAFKRSASDIVDDELTRVCEAAVRYVNVATATGSPPSMAELVAIREALDGRIPLALVGGVDEDNIDGLKAVADIFLATLSIIGRVKGVPGESFIPEKVRRLADLIHA